MPAKKLTEANRHERLSCLKQLLNDVIFTWFSDKKAIHISYTEKFTERLTVCICCNKQQRRRSKTNTFTLNGGVK